MIVLYIYIASFPCSFPAVSCFDLVVSVYNTPAACRMEKEKQCTNENNKESKHGQKFVCSEGHPLSWSILTSRLVTVQHYIHTVQQNIIIVQRNIITYVFLSSVLRLTLFCCNFFPCWKNQEIRTERCITRKREFPTQIYDRQGERGASSKSVPATGSGI